MRRAALLLSLSLLAAPAAAQIESREGIALQNQILQLRQEIEMLRRRGAGRSPCCAAPGRAGGGAGILTAQLLDRVARLEEEVRALRGRAETAEFQLRQLREALDKLEGDTDFRFQQLQGGAARPAAPPPPPPAAARRRRRLRRPPRRGRRPAHPPRRLRRGRRRWPGGFRRRRSRSARG